MLRHNITIDDNKNDNENRMNGSGQLNLKNFDVTEIFIRKKTESDILHEFHNIILLDKSSVSSIYIATCYKYNYKKVVIKKIKCNEYDKNNIPSSKRIMNEITIMYCINHPGIVPLLDVYFTPLHVYLIMPYYEGGDLYKYLTIFQLNEERAAKLFLQLVTTINFLHSNNIIHRDIKLENIFLTSLDKDNFNLVLGDFGFSTIYDKNQTSYTSLGTEWYAAPELILGQTYKGYEIDIWSLGILLYTLCKSALPFLDKDRGKRCYNIFKNVYDKSGLSSSFIDLFEGMCEIDPAKRLTIDQILLHPWLRSNGKRTSIIDIEEKTKSEDSLRNSNPNDIDQKSSKSSNTTNYDINDKSPNLILDNSNKQENTNNKQENTNDKKENTNSKGEITENKVKGKILYISYEDYLLKQDKKNKKASTTINSQQKIAPSKESGSKWGEIIRKFIENKENEQLYNQLTSLPINVQEWTLSDIIIWLACYNLNPLQYEFIKQNIDGRRLLNLTEEEIKKVSEHYNLYIKLSQEIYNLKHELHNKIINLYLPTGTIIKYIVTTLDKLTRQHIYDFLYELNNIYITTCHIKKNKITYRVIKSSKKLQEIAKKYFEKNETPLLYIIYRPQN
ncbi:MAG: protein kinase [Propionibacteriaceae bacterium]|nr:protein kinase [Propionibacteriaceae bacterium]